ncbi:MAG: L-histidine N(alpha)-methyltransferase [Scytolyngbya sp. HA4215-MV1]|jgi:ubiquinone/menaquinone biosynthesis C-methylase UbiE|nr:L-histidine N(alpha)-methyltransferase [Scytolyngbya sp. HA4215-MV1]
MNLSNPEVSNKIKQYWCERAGQTDPASLQATTYDVYLRELEITKLKEKISAASLPHGSTVVDLGCGDGYSTMSLASAFPDVRFIGIDWSEEMLTLAEKKLSVQLDLLDRVSFRVGDMRSLSSSLQAERFDVFLTMRSLINLTSSAEQYNTISQIAEHLKPGGYYFCIENFMQGQNNFNRMRVTMGLPEIPVRWHNHFFEEEEFLVETSKFFDPVIIDSFLSSYYLATRVIYSAGCHLMGEEPDYFHPIHQTAGQLPVIGDFSPIKLASMRRKL